MKATDSLSRDEIQRLIEPSDAKGALAVATTWAVIAGCFAAVALFPSVLTVVLALVLLGGRHLALAILMHDAAHYSLFKTRKLNDWVGSWLCSYPTWQDLGRYRPYHIRHHKFAGSEQDPDASLVSPFPITRKSLARKLLRDLSGVSGVKRVYGLMLMDLGYIEYTVASDVKPIDQKGRSLSEVVATGFRNLRGVAIMNAALFAALAAVGHPSLYLLWVGSYLTTFSVIVRVRSIAEHACTERDPDPRKNTRTTYAGWIARLTVAPHRVNYHLEHHLLMTVPYFSLPVMHRLLRERGALEGAYVSKGYLEVLATASSRT